MFTIYALIDPRDNLVHYVGCTSKPLAVRMSGHMSDSCGERRWLWIKDMRAAGVKPIVAILETIAGDKPEAARDAEARWLEWFGRAEAPLTNRYPATVSPCLDRNDC